MTGFQAPWDLLATSVSTHLGQRQRPSQIENRKTSVKYFVFRAAPSVDETQGIHGHAMRTTYLVCYDIADDKRLRRVFKTCKNYGDHLQFSVFECDLNPMEKVRFESELKEIIDHLEDQVLFVSLGPAEGRGDRVITALGLPYVSFDAPCLVY